MDCAVASNSVELDEGTPISSETQTLGLGQAVLELLHHTDHRADLVAAKRREKCYGGFW